jgi:hypothetical protein
VTFGVRPALPVRGEREEIDLAFLIVSDLYGETRRNNFRKALASKECVMNVYTWPHDLGDLRNPADFFRRFLKHLVSIISGGNSGWESGARSL